MKVKKEVEVYIDPFNDDPYNLEWGDRKPQSNFEQLLQWVVGAVIFIVGLVFLFAIVSVVYSLIDAAIKDPQEFFFFESWEWAVIPLAIPVLFIGGAFVLILWENIKEKFFK